MTLSARETSSTRQSIIDAARNVLMSDGYSGLSTRAVAVAANTQMSQIRYHFGSKDGLILALFDDMTERLISRQSTVFNDPEIPLSRKWALSCDFLDQDLDSGYVRVLQELIAVGWSNPMVGDAVRTSFGQLRDMHVALAKDLADRIGGLGPFAPEDVAALVGSAFIGAEAYLLLGLESDALPLRRALRRVGDLIAQHEPPESAKE